MSVALNSPQAPVPALTKSQMNEIVRIMVEEYGLSHLLMMENAGRNLANLTRRLLGGNVAHHKIAVLAGAGHCGAIGLVAARFLANAGADLTVLVARPTLDLSQMALHQQRILTRLGIVTIVQTIQPALQVLTGLRQAEIIIDALIGGGLRGAPNGAEAFLIQTLRQVGKPVLSLDLPSGLPGDGEKPIGPFVRAEATLALALPRLAHINLVAAPFLGELYLADIGVPSVLYQRMGLNVGPIFSAGDVIYLRKRES